MNQNVFYVPKEWVRVDGNLQLSNEEYIEKYRVETGKSRDFKNQIFISFLEIIRPIPFEKHFMVSEGFHQVMNLCYPKVSIKKKEEKKQ